MAGREVVDALRSLGGAATSRQIAEHLGVDKGWTGSRIARSLGQQRSVPVSLDRRTGVWTLGEVSA